ncbi:Uncharacterised protein [Mycobacteroides abscessus subsp. massiliense]|uniref:hypothetical protein n=1 Tax=Mycobacteroides abscessus TaxID=36809 RepID=UPI0009A88C4E|nr:hypothetical protein [Mycobacteroides abscessus]SLI41298.1 Uncharacterised protein [Mycobacteroides abscessus subsp. massiliense]
MKKNLMLAAASTLTVGLLAACGSTSAPSASPVPADKDCTELARPADPHNLIGREWPWPACSALDDVQPGVNQERAEAVVFDARQRVAAAKRNIAVLATVGNGENDPEALTEFHGRIENVRGRLADDLMASRLALQGTPPEGFSLDYSKTHDPKSCADAWDFDKCTTTGGRDKGQPPPYLTHTASPGLTEGQAR